LRGHNRPGKHLITSLLIVPHAQLAWQLFHWVRRIATATGTVPSLPLVCQVLVRDSVLPTLSQIESLRKEPPHILIATPTAILDVYNEDLDALHLETLSTVVVDDADYMIPTVARNSRRTENMKKIAKAKIDRCV
jgi:superfamily II DNA/RNA helicase